jgi:outer membrane murein-binding lipoprotein Lpp
VKKLIVTTLILAAMVLSGCQVAGEDPRIVELQDKVASLESQVADLTAGTYLLDNAGLHAIDEGLQEADEIDASYLGVIQRIRGVVAATPWPEELQAQATALVETMDSLAAALEADDLEAARAGATETHEVQHEFSHAVGEWLAEHGVVPEGEHSDE